MSTTLRVCVPADAEAPLTARAALRGLPGVDDGLLEIALLLLSELVTNSVVHAGLRTDAEIEITMRSGPGLRVEVADGGPGIDGRAGSATTDGDSGRGLFLVEALATRWGAERSRGGLVWFELDGHQAADEERRPPPAAP